MDHHLSCSVIGKRVIHLPGDCGTCFGTGSHPRTDRFRFVLGASRLMERLTAMPDVRDSKHRECFTNPV